jgi:S1-C subfamily serine protease
MRFHPLLPLLLALSLSLLVACGGSDDAAKGSPTATAGSPAASARPTSIADLAHAVVQIQALDSRGDAVWRGSGTFISADGLILTNGHVVDDRQDEYRDLGVAITSKTDQPPELRYLAKIVAVDYALDLAVIKIDSDLTGRPVRDQFPFISRGDSDAIDIGDAIRILGYPGIGGETITLTDGVVSGFTAERGVGGRAWIKTNATIAGGNSGGLAVDSKGQIIGVPTIAGSGANSSTVDCRLIEDTNRDGRIDDRDTCVPVGGFINGLRPVNLATPLVEAAESGRQYVSRIEPATPPASGFDASNVVISNLVFGADVTPDEKPTKIVTALPSRAQKVCAFWDYEGMENGMSWEAVWYVDGVLSDEGSIIGDTWIGGPDGNWWACIVDEEKGLPDGLYEVIISVEGEARGSDAIFAGGSHPNVSLNVDNRSGVSVCYAFISLSGALNWGFDRLDPGEEIDAGAKHTFKLPAAKYDLLLEDCSQDTIAEEHELDVGKDTTYTVR